MEETKQILIKLEEKYSDIDYYNIVIDKIERNVDINPDIAIESCKSLLEGISKFLLKTLDDNYDSKENEKTDCAVLYKKSLNKVSEFCDMFDEDIVNRASSTVHRIGELRNERGDISHGKLSPKTFTSNVYLSRFVVSITDALISYTLKCFSEINLEPKIYYEDNNSFNEWLDEQYSKLMISYSKGLFDQDIEAYKQELFEYQDSNEDS